MTPSQEGKCVPIDDVGRFDGRTGSGVDEHVARLRFPRVANPGIGGYGSACGVDATPR
ncbi:hypothetical protein [Nocardioides immobilis]|uniref:hypothetical protein n=1 Tax=Nocardioides immobilis TaxID=2049295 RepID=UPI0015FA0BA7|nr:hypothetical protein [Nocardioides immobilis]